MVRTTLVYAFVGLFISILGPIGLAWALLTGRTGILYDLSRTCIRIAGWMCGIRLQVRGRDGLVPGQTYLFLSNHQGNFDGPILFYATGRDLRAVIKKEMMKIPILSTIFRMVDFVPIDRFDPLRARASIDRATQLLSQGYSFFAFPEGTRSRDGRLGAFKKGVFVMAIKAGVPVVPVTIQNSRAIQPPGRFRITPGPVYIVFHTPIATGRMGLENRDQLLQQVRASILECLSDR